MTDATEAIPDGDPPHMTCHNLSHLNNTTTSHDLMEDIDPTHTARAGLNHQEEDMAIVPI